RFTTASQTVAESVGTVTVTAQLSLVSGFPVTVPFTTSGTATSGVDYSVSSPITILAGSLTGTAVITVVDDTSYEPSATAILTMGTPTNATVGSPSTYTLTITDNDSPPSVTFTSGGRDMLNETGSGAATLSLSQVSGFDITVPFTVSGTATNGVDYTIDA